MNILLGRADFFLWHSLFKQICRFHRRNFDSKIIRRLRKATHIFWWKIFVSVRFEQKMFFISLIFLSVKTFLCDVLFSSTSLTCYPDHGRSLVSFQSAFLPFLYWNLNSQKFQPHWRAQSIAALEFHDLTFQNHC